ncbi:MAG TPA: hypothetical protein VMA83_10775 [Solirubrobacteraceae bacterium]|nr:hypothetical protein [Solirubrobacteraceae bacterium]
MNDVQKRTPPAPRQARERRAFRLIAVGGAAAVVGVVGLVLAIAGVVSAALPVLALAIAAGCAFLFRRTVGA